MSTPWRQRYAQRMQWMGSSMIRELLKLTARPEIISFAGGLPAPELFPVEEFQAATDRVLSQNGCSALQYSTTEGFMPLREFLADKMAAYGIEAGPENILITSGAQQAIDIIGKMLINPGDRILTEQPTYLGALQSWRAYQAEFVTVPIDHDGLRVDLLEEVLCSGPKFMYILPNFQNPGGVTLSLARRYELIEIADHYGIPIVEDDPYGELRYEGEHLPPLVVVDNDLMNDTGATYDSYGSFMRGNLIYLGTFSKTLAPGLRLGWMVAPKSVIERAVMAKQGMDLHSSSFVQMVAYEVVKDGFLKQHVQHIRTVYGERRDVMLAAMARHFPPSVAWTRPDGGLFLWVTLPEGVDASVLFEKAVANNVAYVPGIAFDPLNEAVNTFRLNFSNAQPDVIEEGIRRLGSVLTAELAGQHELIYAAG
ncbi:MAG: PLP-dependent aminotransferase family protein [Anaerolineae bacterium]|nr:PLP-dependent aminotransferase family protein [Anaerolineae bacterium]MCO5195070.1 PLP-dependent aminotransferase family protein [Anaerolineae bacterium]MCO5197258.1 PLP-dependent aminotransferase family protein [Anaerolineae bacterium]MCO5204804.1 PLP-dependent aminotransferase family protein [Anaerolineae bacterium]